MYCTTAEVLGKIRDDMIDAILGSELIEDEQERAEKITTCTEEAISDACAEIDGWVSKRYKVPFSEPVPPIVSKLAKDIAVYNLASRTGIDEDDRENTIYIRYKNAITFLTNVAKGLANIDTGQDTADGSGTAAANDGFFYWDDTFYWGKRPEQEYLYELNDSNILELEKSGGSWTAEVIGVPWIHHSQYININHENLIAVGEVESVTVESNDKGMMEMYITFREVEDG